MADITCPVKMMDGSTCGQYPYSDASDLCRVHFEHRYPQVFERLQHECRCPKCSGTGEAQLVDEFTGEIKRETCPKCGGRKWVDERS